MRQNLISNENYHEIFKEIWWILLINQMKLISKEKMKSPQSSDEYH